MNPDKNSLKGKFSLYKNDFEQFRWSNKSNKSIFAQGNKETSDVAKQINIKINSPFKNPSG